MVTSAARSVPLVDLVVQHASIADDVMRAVAEVAREQRFVLGARVEAFERWLAQACGVGHAVGVASGTDAIALALRALGVGAGDAVVTSAFSFVASAEAIAAVGARPVFADIDPGTMNVSPETIEAAIARARKEGMRVRAIVPVHLFGLCAPMDGILAIARREGLVVMEDAAQAIGAREATKRGARAAGSFGDAAALSFFPTKNLGAWGDGGAVVTSREDVAARVRSLRAHGAVATYRHAELGANSRLDALQAAVLLAKAPHLERWTSARARIAARYRKELASVDLPLVLPSEAEEGGRSAWHAFVVRTPVRDELGAWLRERGVESRVYYPVPLHHQPCFEYLGAPPCLRHAEGATRTALALPMYPELDEGDQRAVIDAVRTFSDR
jgi:dTDP-4-amino-4,6-dideoxygalactose transaminase